MPSSSATKRRQVLPRCFGSGIRNCWPSRAGEHARNFLGTWNGKRVCDDFAGYKASFEQGITEIGCMAHARRKFFDLHVVNKSQLAEQALHSIGGLYEVERHAKEMSDEDRWRLRQEMAVPIAEKLHEWMLVQRELVPEGRPRPRLWITASNAG